MKDHNTYNSRLNVTFLILTSLLVGGVGGYLASSVMQIYEATKVNPDMYLYTDWDSAELSAMEIYKRADHLYGAIHEMSTDYRDRPPILVDRQMKILNMLRENDPYHELIVSLAMISVQGKDAEIRIAGISVLSEWQTAFAKARYMIERHLSMEDSKPAMDAKEAFLALEKREQ